MFYLHGHDFQPVQNQFGIPLREDRPVQFELRVESFRVELWPQPCRPKGAICRGMIASPPRGRPRRNVSACHNARNPRLCLQRDNVTIAGELPAYNSV